MNPRTNSSSASVMGEIEEKFFTRMTAHGTAGSPYWREPGGIIRFVREVIGAEPRPYQEEILEEFVQRRRVAIRSPHGVGKSCLASWAVLWLIAAYPPQTDVKVVTTASAWRQLEKYLWPEIHKWARQADWSLAGLTVRHQKELLGLSLRLFNKEAFAAASDHPELIEGAHATVVAYIFDEAKAIPDGTWDAAEGAFSQEGLEGFEAYALAISTPGDEVGRFYDIHMGRPGFQDWWKRHVTLREAIDAGQISPEWANNRKRQWGEDSVVYQRRVLGNFASSSAQNVIPLEWVEAANGRWLNRNDIDNNFSYDVSGGENTESEEVEIAESPEAMGIDPARYGEDKTSIAWFQDYSVTIIERMAKMDLMSIANYINASDQGQGLPKAVDVIGVGAGVVDRLREMGHSVMGVNVSEPTLMTDISGELSFLNLRSLLWWLMREYLDPSAPRGRLIDLPPDEELTAELVIPKWTETARGTIKVESKSDIRKRLSRSTDSADSVMLAMYASLMMNSSGIWV